MSHYNLATLSTGYYIAAEGKIISLVYKKYIYSLLYFGKG